MPLNRLVLHAGASYINAHDRPGYEIDARVRRREIGYNGGVELRALAKTSLIVNASRLKVDYDDTATFEGVSLQNELNRVSTTFGGGVKYQATSLTSFSLTASRLEDRFESRRCATRIRRPRPTRQLRSGRARQGQRVDRLSRLPTVVPGLESFHGFTTDVNLCTRCSR